MSFFRSQPLGSVRWAVVDCETSGLDPARDRLLSVAAVRVESERVRLAEAFNAIVGQVEPSAAANILVHGIGGEAQLAGRPAGEVLRGLLAFMDGAVPVAFHAPFDEKIVRRAAAAVGLDAPSKWLDLAELLRALFPARARTCESLDDWLREFAIECPVRHEALSDAFAGAQLLLLLLAEARRQGVTTMRGLTALPRSSRWLV